MLKNMVKRWRMGHNKIGLFTANFQLTMSLCNPLAYSFCSTPSRSCATPRSFYGSGNRGSFYGSGNRGSGIRQQLQNRYRGFSGPKLLEIPSHDLARQGYFLNDL